MTPTRRISSILAVAAAEATGPLGPKINPISELDELTVTGIPEESRGRFPGIAGQLNGLDRLNEPGQLHQLADQAAPVAGLLPVSA
ncbi:hypothetical protein [Streptomyces litmocidini]|uniref:hypothetical protein n=1 Tax=Streptomyces litmocidini TaxID=67318 RepID=UPI0036FD7AD7